ncbi:TMEM165/GDT1 family protein [[Eubacterium] cellulosolvens]
MDPTIAAFIASFLSITVSELGDKTQLGLMMMSTTLRKPTTIFLGIIIGFAIVAGVAVLVGQSLHALIPLSTIVWISGLVFIAAGLLMLKVDVHHTPRIRSRRGTLYATSLVIALTELGDKTQIMTIALATGFRQPIAVFSRALLAFAAIDGVSILLAGSLGKQLAMGKVRQISAIVFMAIGILRLLKII